MKKFIYILSVFALLFTGCSDDDDPDFMTSLLVIDTEKVTAEGSFVQGTALSNTCKAVIPYSNGSAGKVTVSAPRINGIQIAEQEVQIDSKEGEMNVSISGTPVALETTFLQINITVGSKKYISSVEIPVIADSNPDGKVTLTLSKTSVVGITGEEIITFTVDPTMAYVYVANEEEVQNLGMRIDQDLEIGTGSVILNPGADFLSAILNVSAEFGARPVQIENLEVNAFNVGDGSTESPYTIETVAHLAKLTVGNNKAFILQDDLSLESWTN